MKKIFGITFILIGSLLSIVIIGSIPNTISKTILLLKRSTSSYSLGYAMGGLIFFIPMVVIAYFLFKFGLKWIKK